MVKGKMKALYEILVPTIFGDNGKPISTKHHKEWDKFVQKITGGLTILKPAQGRWVNKGVEYPERVIPVRIMIEKEEIPEVTAENLDDLFNETKIEKIIQFTLKHYRQRAVMYYVVSNDVHIVYA